MEDVGTVEQRLRKAVDDKKIVGASIWWSARGGRDNVTIVVAVQRPIGGQWHRPQ